MKTARFSARVDVDSDDGGFKSMKRTIVTCIIRIVFAFWLVVSIALVLATVGTLLPTSDRPWLSKLTSTVLTVQGALLRTDLQFQRLAARHGLACALLFPWSNGKQHVEDLCS
jgi:hypothetical protein